MIFYLSCDWPPSAGQCVQQPLGVGMLWPVKYIVRVSCFHYCALVHYQYSVADVVDYRQIVGDE
jgi:hypothetical protein